MKYICLGYIDSNAFACAPEAGQQAMMDSCFAYDDLLRAKGHFKGGEALRPPTPAIGGRCMSTPTGRIVVTDGPFAETKEQLGGIMILEARDLNHAVELISSAPTGAKFGLVGNPARRRPERDGAPRREPAARRPANREPDSAIPPRPRPRL